MRVGVTGGSGFIGTVLVRHLLEAGHEVAVLDLVRPNTDGVRWVPVDVKEADKVANAARGLEVIYHLAAVASVNAAFSNPSECVRANILGTSNVLEAARANGLRRVIFASTIWVYQASPEGRKWEGSSFSPKLTEHLYTASKIAGEMLCHSYQRLYQVPFTVLRYGIPYGPFMREELLIPTFIRKILRREPLSVNGNGSQYRKFIYIDDLARGNVAALSAKAENQTYSLEGVERVTVMDVAQALDRALGAVHIQFLPGRPGDLDGVEIDSDEAKRDLGWEPVIPFDEGLRRTVVWFKNLYQRKGLGGPLVASV